VSSLASPRVLNIADLRAIARRRMPRVVFDYLDGGAEAEQTLRANEEAFAEIAFRPRGAVVVPDVKLAVDVVGQRLAVPFALAPVGSTRLFYRRGEVLVARAAAACGTAYALSTLAGTALEEVRAASTGPLFYQLYLVGGRDVASKAIVRAKEAGYAALMVTIDTPVSGMREKDFRNGIKQLLSNNPFAMLPYVGQFLSRPAWLWDFVLDGGMMKFPNVVLPDTGPMEYADVSVALEQAVVTWDDLGWIRELWGGPVIVKGILTADDARRAVDVGADALVVSNHGGRQLDGAPATARVLPEIVASVGKQIEVLVDGGIRRGADVVKALCLGARAVLVGRAYAYGLGAGGEAGVARALEILRSDVVRTMKLLGCADVADLDASLLDVPARRSP